MSAAKELVHICGAGDSFREPGAKDAVVQHACRWFFAHLRAGLEPRIRELDAPAEAKSSGLIRINTAAQRSASI
jgi:hypothetical protein